MSKEQIDEMARIIGHCESTLHPDIECHNKATGCYCIENPCHNQRIAEALYNAGYRKQSEGEWIIKVGPLVNDKKISCSICGYTEYRGPAWEKSWGLYPYCPNCGAKMKGGAE